MIINFITKDEKHANLPAAIVAYKDKFLILPEVQAKGITFFSWNKNYELEKRTWYYI